MRTFPAPTLLRLGLMLLLMGSVAACASGPPVRTGSAEAEYQRAIEDARTAEPSEISTALTPITAANDALIWRDAPGQSRLLVVTWGGADLFADAPSDTLTTSDVVWVTAVPEVQQTCRAFDGPDAALTRRLEQLIGLPPDADYTQFAELWVDPADLFRPCPDPEITDRECERDFPQSERFLTVDPKHKQWIRELRRTTYGADGYPWTRLGYTYDWNPATDEFGVSEFVIRSGASVVVRQIQSTAAYCRGG